MVAVALDAASWLVTARPTYTALPIGTVSVPIGVHCVPSLEAYAVNWLALRTRRTHMGGALEGPLVLSENPPGSMRRWNPVPLPVDDNASAWREPGSSVSRIITPAFAQLLEP